MYMCLCFSFIDQTKFMANHRDVYSLESTAWLSHQDRESEERRQTEGIVTRQKQHATYNGRPGHADSGGGHQLAADPKGSVKRGMGWGMVVSCAHNSTAGLW